MQITRLKHTVTIQVITTSKPIRNLIVTGTLTKNGLTIEAVDQYGDIVEPQCIPYYAISIIQKSLNVK